MPRLLTSLLVLLLGAWPARSSARDVITRNARARRGPSRLGETDARDPVEAPERARARTRPVHRWPGEIAFSAGDRRIVVHGLWRLTLDPAHRAQTAGAAGRLTLDPSCPEVWETELEALLTCQVPGARMQISRADTHGWELLEVRAPTAPETVVHLDRTALGQVFDCEPELVRVTFTITGQGTVSDFARSSL